jgi:hypothetical protein
MIVKTIARKIGRNPSSNGQLMKTALEAGGLGVRRFTARLLGLCPQRVADSLGGGRTLTAHGSNLDPAINYRAFGSRRMPGTSILFCSSGHSVNMRFLDRQSKDSLVGV